MNELKVFVERCVRPVRAEASRKLEMRRELFSHLESVYEQERTRNESEEAAIQAAITRMGEPQELAKALNASLSILDRCTGTLDELSSRKIHESPRQYAIRMAKLVLKTSLVLIVPVLVASFLIAGQWGIHQQFLVRFCVAFVAFELLGCLMCVWFFGALRDRLEQQGWSKNLVAFVFGMAAAMLLGVPIAGWVFYFFVSGDATEATAFLPRWMLLSLLVCPGVLWAAWLDARLTRDLRQWQELQIDE